MVRLSRAATAVMATVLTLGGAAAPVHAVTQAAVVGDPSGCKPYLKLDEKLTLSRANKLTIPPLPSWTLPANPTWRENPFHDAMWAIRYESLRYVDHLFANWCTDGDQALLERARFLISDWVHDNGQDAAARWAWYDHSVAWRTFVLIDAVGVMPLESWLLPEIEEHGAWLAEHSNGVGNHALNANRGLLAAGCFTGRQNWIDLAVHNIDGLLRDSVDAQGVTNAGDRATRNTTTASTTRHATTLACGQPESTYFKLHHPHAPDARLRDAAQW